MDAEKIAKLGLFLEKWSAAGYPYAEGEQRDLAESVFSELYQLQGEDNAAAKNAGYNADLMIKERQEFAEEHRAYQEAQGRKLPEETIFEKRAMLLRQAFGVKREIQDINALKQERFNAR